MSMKSLYDVYVGQLKDIYSAEKQLTEALPKMVEAASTKELKQAFQHHLEQTHQHMETVRTILDDLDENPTSTACKAMQGLVEEGSEVVKEKGDAKAKDAALILAAQKVEHYEIATYGGLVTYARSLEYPDVADRLQMVLNQEYDADQKLDDLAMGSLLNEGINEEAED